MKSRGKSGLVRLVTRNSASMRSFIANSAAPRLPHIKAAILNEHYQPFQATLVQELENEYQHNPICQPLLAQVDQLLAKQSFSVIISPSLEIDRLHFDRFKTICGYDVRTKVLLMPSAHDAHLKLFPESKYTSKNDVDSTVSERYTRMFLHEANHAHDFVAGGFKTNKSDAIALTACLANGAGLFADPSMRKIERVLGVTYSQEVMNQLKRAFKDDLLRLFEMARDNQHPDQFRAHKALETMQTSLMPYSVLHLLFEFKSRYVEFSASSSLGADFMQAMFPAVSSWYLHQHMPACQDELNQSNHLRK